MLLHYFSRCSYQKTESAIKTTAGKTTSVIGGIAGKMTQKLTEMKQSDSFRSFEERVGSAYENVRVSGVAPYDLAISHWSCISNCVDTMRDFFFFASSPKYPHDRALYKAYPICRATSAATPSLRRRPSPRKSRSPKPSQHATLSLLPDRELVSVVL